LYSLAEVHHVNVDADHVGNARGTSTRSWRVEQYSSVVVVLPVLHEQANHLPALLLEQQRGHRRVDAAGQTDDHCLSSLIFVPC
jgi:hypothetical protein